MCRTKEKSSAFDQKDIPSDIDYCFVLKWAGHDAFNCAKNRLGPARVFFVARPGLQTLTRELIRWARTLPDPVET